jgi:hypothetical protein
MKKQGHKENKLSRTLGEKICEACKKLLTDKNGMAVGYQNTGPMGTGCEGIYIDNDLREPYPSNECFIGQNKFIAAEHRFGGIVVQKVGAC